MNTQLIVFFAVIISVSGKFVRHQEPDDYERTSSHPQWKDVQYGAHRDEEEQEEPLWKENEYDDEKEAPEHHVVSAASKARVSAEVQAMALAYQAAAQAKAIADQEAEESLWKAKLAKEDESKAVLAAREAELASKSANISAINSQKAVQELNKSLMAAQDRAEKEYHIAIEKYNFAEELRLKAISTTEARVHANYEAALAAQKAKSAKEALWRAKRLASSW